MGRFRPSELCNNLNHRRAHAPIGHCPECGGVVNERIAAQQCSETHHAAARRSRCVFCVDCGTRLIFDR
jgi:hypothetical protein